jgi:UDP-N-acetylglucosamine 2-epimerase (non-hydrolysing)
MSEGIEPSRVVVTGNTIVEALGRLMPSLDERLEVCSGFGLRTGEFVLSTLHRPENVDDPIRFATILRQLGMLRLPVLLPLHPRSRDRAARFGLDPELARLQVVDPMGYSEFLALSAESAFLVSDSGGIQEEASIYKRPVVVVRRSTERPEVLGTFASLVEPGEISSTVGEWLADLGEVHRRLSEVPCPYGDGSASARVVAETAKLVADA